MSEAVERKPEWLRIRLNTSPCYAFLKLLVLAQRGPIRDGSGSFRLTARS